jgi:curved DNA-binding protein CbpA
MGNTQSGNSQVNLYEQYLNEQKRIIAAQQQQINNLTRMNLQNNTVQHKHAIPTNIYVQSMPIRNPQNTYSGDSYQQQFPQLEDKTPVASGSKDKLNPYKILGVTKNYDEKSLKKAYLKKALVTHPDRGGSPVEFQKVSIAYTLLLKKIKDKENNHDHNDLRNHSQSYMSNQQSDNIRNVNMTEQFDINLFNKIYEENKEESVYDRGYGDWMKKDNGQKMLQQPKMFNKTFNKDLFNHEFEKYKLQQQKQMGTQIVKYDEPQVDISMRGKDSLMILGQNNISDFSGTSEGGLTFRDYRDAFTNSCLIDTGSVNLENRDNNIKEVERTRSNISYQMSERDLRKQQMIKMRMEKEEHDRINRLNQQDNRAFAVYEQIHSRLIG